MMKSRCHVSLVRLAFVLAAAGLLAAANRAAAETYAIQTVSYVGQAGDSVQGVGIQADGTLVVAANISGGPLVAGGVKELGQGNGVVLRLTPDGRRLLSATRVAKRVRDLALDAGDNLYLAADAEGAVKLDRAAARLLWQRDVGGTCVRIAAGSDGTSAALRYGRDDDSAPGAGQLYVFDPQGKPLANFAGHRNTLDVCVDSASRTVILIGWRQANAFDGKKKEPVQIAYLRGCSYAGQPKYTLYDWSTDNDAPEFINRPTNNMADTRGYRCAIGRDGNLYCAFECAGGNHIFRWEPQLQDGQWRSADAKQPKADQFHAFYNSRAEHKTFMGRYEPASGKYLAGQGLCGRLSSGRANAARVVNGAVAAAESGALLLGGTSAFGLPLSFTPPETGDYSGGSHLLVMQPDLKSRAYCTRFQAGGQTRALDARHVGGKTVIVLGGSNNAKEPGQFWTKDALQPNGEAGCGFLAVLTTDATAK
jgi:hypothetical protein